VFYIKYILKKILLTGVIETLVKIRFFNFKSWIRL